ncbi:DUF924 family protein [Peteryoungia desertarenae]|uniref:DUF924 family protein n=1 Tax=Peteryoungia desertarenae TaxID=1813451 RepID=A0ABX6QRS9_9HYPH|nr:DUF924 family protein [Peteryoungia desertarenae]
MITPSDVVGFWQSAGPEKWFAKDEAFDEAIRDKFLDLHFAASRNELQDWCDTAEGALALMLLLDQFPRNLFRGSGHAFATDGLARHIADQAMERGFHLQVEPALAIFFYLPLEHSEQLEDQKRCLALFQEHFARTGDQVTLDYAQLHLDIIERFGRFPHRNKALGRVTTPEEITYLEEGGFKG